MIDTRQTHLDALRGIAALIVVSAHYFAAFYPYTLFGPEGEYNQHLPFENIFFTPPFGLLVAGQFSVSLFFILSGYVLSYHMLGKPNQRIKIIASIVKRPFRLGGLVWFSMIISALFWYFQLYSNTEVSELSYSVPWFSRFWNDDLDVYRFFTDLLTSSFSTSYFYNDPLWTIKIELYGSIFVYVFLLLFGNSRFRLVISILLIVISYNSLYQGFWLGLTVAELVKSNYMSLRVLNQKKYMYVLIFGFVYLSSYPNYATEEFISGTMYGFLLDDGGFGEGYAMLSALLAFIIVICNNNLRVILNKPLFQFFGRISYGLYVVHVLVLGTFSAWLFLQLHDYFDYGIAFIIVVLTSFPVIIILAYLITRYVDNPVIILSKQIGKSVSSSIRYFSSTK